MTIQDAIFYFKKYSNIVQAVQANEVFVDIHSYRHIDRIDIDDNIMSLVDAVELLAENTREKAPKKYQLSYVKQANYYKIAPNTIATLHTIICATPMLYNFAV